jgi:coproporphyrinogen III oxidase-like Fe-S oxidoreductase
MAKKVAEVLVDVLAEAGVQRESMGLQAIH